MISFYNLRSLFTEIYFLRNFFSVLFKFLVLNWIGFKVIYFYKILKQVYKCTQQVMEVLEKALSAFEPQVEQV